jgi:hypothetical protein
MRSSVEGGGWKVEGGPAPPHPSPDFESSPESTDHKLTRAVKGESNRGQSLSGLRETSTGLSSELSELCTRLSGLH